MSFFRSSSSSTVGNYARLPPRNPGLPPAPSSQSYARHQPPDNYEKHAHARQQAEPLGRYNVTSAPNEGLSLSNKLIVNPNGPFRKGDHVLVNDRFPVTVILDNTDTIRPNEIGTSPALREWAGLSKTGGQATVQPLPSQTAHQYIQSLDIEAAFYNKKKVVSEQFSMEEMAENFKRAHDLMVFSIGEILLFEFHGHHLKLVIKGLSIVDLPQNATIDSNAGILMGNTDINFLSDGSTALKFKLSGNKPPPNAILAPNFRFEDMGIGGLDSEFSSIFRRAFASRVFPPALIEKLGIQHVKGILLYGPPGTGKTLMARQIGKMLNAREPKIVNGPEILNKFVGASEENIRKLFADAEAEYKAKGEESGLHIIIFDELDAICKQRGSTNSGTGVGDSVVNQLLSKLDGVDQLNNILVIGMTNRKDMIDEALLRPGRLEVQMEISLPDEAGRKQIISIHTEKMRMNNVMEHDVDLQELAEKTKNFSGAEIAGLVKSATSFAFNRHVKVGTIAGISDDVEKLRVNRGDFLNALDEVHPAFGVAEEELEAVVRNGIIEYDAVVNELLHQGDLNIEQVRSSARTPLVSVLLYGPPGSGKTALAARIAQRSKYPFIKLITPETMVGMAPGVKIAAINKVFMDSYKSPLSVIVMDNLERLLEWVNIGPNFSNPVLQALLVLLKNPPPKGNRLLVIATTSIRSMLVDTELPDVFDKQLPVRPISTLTGFEAVLRHVDLFDTEQEVQKAMQMVKETGFGTDNSGRGYVIGVKKLLSIIEGARQEPQNVAGALQAALYALKF